MRHAILFLAVLILMASSNAQTLGVSTVTSDTTEIITGRFPSLPDRHFLIFEARLPAASAQRSRVTAIQVSFNSTVSF